MNDRPRGLFFFLFLLISVLPLFSAGLWNHGLWTPDEPRVAEIGREMAVSGNWAVPTLNKRPFLEHPPFHYAAMAAVFRALGMSEGAARLPSAVFALGGVVTIFLVCLIQFGPRVGFLSAFVLATSVEYFRVGNWAVVDSALALFIYLALLCFWVAYSGQDRWRRLLFYSLCYVFCSLAFYTKGFIGVALPGVAVLVFLSFDRNLKEILRMHLWLGVLVFGALTLPWFLSLWHQGGDEFIKVFLLRNHLERFAGGSTGHNQPIYYYMTQLPAGFLPWSLMIVPAGVWLLRIRKEVEVSQKKALLFATCWFISGFALLSAASTKRILYLMPIFAPASILVGCYVDSMFDRPVTTWFDRFFAYLFGLVPLVVGVAAIPFLLYASRRYGLSMGPGALVGCGVFSFVIALLAFLGLWSLKRSGKRFWLFTGGSLVSLLLLALIVVVPLVDQQKSFVPFCNEVAAKVPPAAGLYVYQPDETIRGAIPFYSGRYLIEIETLDSLKAAMGRERSLYVIARDSRGRLGKEIESAGPFDLLAQKGMGEHRALVLYVLTSPLRLDQTHREAADH